MRSEDTVPLQFFFVLSRKMDSTHPILIECDKNDEEFRKSEEISRWRRYLPQVKKNKFSSNWITNLYRIEFQTNVNVDRQFPEMIELLFSVFVRATLNIPIQMWSENCFYLISAQSYD